MSLPTYKYVCSECSFTCSDDLPSSRFTIRVYNLDNNVILPLLKQNAWCDNCNSIVNAEYIPSITDIDKVISKFKQSISDAIDQSQKYNLALQAYKKSFIQNIDHHKKWALEQNGRSPRCLNCGHSIVRLKVLDTGESDKSYVHPNCGGILNLQEEDLRIAWKVPDEPTVVKFSASGIKLSAVTSANESSIMRPTSDDSKFITDLHNNPFWLLGATSRDNRKRIVELAEEKSLDLDHDLCQKARADLTNPRTRLVIELSWIPGVSPKKAIQLINLLSKEPMSIREDDSLPALTRANLMAAAFEAVDSKHPPEDLASYIEEFAYAVTEISVDDVIRDINEDRAVSGFPEVVAYDIVEAELIERKRYYKNSIKNALNRLSPTALVETMTLTVDSSTCGGEYQAPDIIDDLVDNYELESQEFLQKESENIHKLIKVILESAEDGEHHVAPLINKLENVAKNWDMVAQPIQLSAKARGIEHELSNEIAYAIRNLGISLFNKHDMLSQSQRLTNLLQELFAELPEVAEKLEEDADSLQEIFQGRKAAEARSREWERSITYSAEIGVVFKDTLSISPRGISWKGREYQLSSVSRVRWGGVRHSVNGIPTGTTYTIAFGDNRSEAIVEVKREDVYSTFTDKLWRAVCVRILTEMLGTLAKGNSIYFDRAKLMDSGIVLPKRKFFGSDDEVHCSWGDVKIYSASGDFCIVHKSDNKIYINLSYINTANTHILEQMIRMAFKKPGLRKLSELLEED